MNIAQYRSLLERLAELERRMEAVEQELKRRKGGRPRKNGETQR